MSAPAAPPHVLLAGGGTGGHLFPGLAVAEELRQRGARVSFVGTRRGIEARVVPREGYPLLFIDVAGLKRVGLVGLLKGSLRLPAAALGALWLLRRQRPQAVIGVGGYASGPVVALAALLGIPTVILEQNSVPGATNRILGRLARRVFIAFPGAAAYFPARRTERLGNPIRRALRQGEPGLLRALSRKEQVHVLVLGGSQGAHAVNELVLGMMEELLKRGKERLPRLTHQTGAADEARVRARYRALGLSYEEAHARAFIDDMGAAYGQCDLVIGRAGATTIAEITALGLPSILVPFPQAADDHQSKNARYLESQGAARVLPQAGAGPEKLAALVEELCHDERLRKRMAEAARLLGRPDAAEKVATAVLQMIQWPGS